jgi:hypothetical protein
MTQERFETGKMPQITVEACQGDLVIRSGPEPAVFAEGDQYESHQSEASLSFSSQGDLSLRLPAAAGLSVTNIQGDLVIKNVNGDVSLSQVQGDAVLAGLGSVKIGAVQGDLSAQNIDGSLRADSIQGDAVLRNSSDVTITTVHGDLAAGYVNGSVHLETVLGDINLHTVNGDVTVQTGERDANLRNLGGKNILLQNIQGDIRLYGDLRAGEHTFVAKGDIVLRWPQDAALNLKATAPQITNRLNLEGVVKKDNTVTGHIGDGQTFVALTADGHIILKDLHLVKEEWSGYWTADDLGFDFDFVADLAGLGEQISSQVNEHVARVTADLETRFGPEFTRQMAEKIAHKAERAAEKAERAAEKAKRRAHRSMKQARWHSQHAPPPPPTPAKPKATKEEQLKILRMVEKGLITPEEADTLLEALES